MWSPGETAVRPSLRRCFYLSIYLRTTAARIAREEVAVRVISTVVHQISSSRRLSIYAVRMLRGRAGRRAWREHGGCKDARYEWSASYRSVTFATKALSGGDKQDNE